MRCALGTMVMFALCSCELLVKFDAPACDETGHCLAGFECIEAVCRPVADAGTACATKETQCGDRLDDDCDGQIDCADTDCNALSCDDQDRCTTRDTCSQGRCKGTAIACMKPGNTCIKSPNGTCNPATGECVYDNVDDGTLCGSMSPSFRCCGGSCVNLSANSANCGGCGLACSTSLLCISINAATTCGEPPTTSARCQCATTDQCPAGQMCTGTVCVPTSAMECAPKQLVTTAPGCSVAYCLYP